MYKINFIKMNESDRLKLRDRVGNVFAIELVRTGDFSDMKNAAKYAKEFIDNKFFKDSDTDKDQSIFNIYDENTHVGVIWYTSNFITSNAEKVGRICYIEIFEQMRMKGYGEESVLFAEDQLQKKMINHITLNVFETNNAAKHLYLKLGYAIVAKNNGKCEMQKMLISN